MENLAEIRKHRDIELKVDLIKQYENELRNNYWKYEYLIQRYEKFIRYDYQDLSQPISAAWVDYTLLMDVHYLYISRLIFDGEYNFFRLYIENLLVKYNNTTGLVSRMILIRMIESSIELLNSGQKNKSISISPMDKEQLSMRKVVGGEMRFIVLSLPKYEDYLINDFSDQNIFRDTLLINSIRKSNLFYLGNMTLNKISNQYTPYIEVSELRYKDFKKEVNHIREKQEEQMQKIPFGIKNMIGNIFIDMINMDWTQYILRPRLLDHKIRIFNILHHGEAWDIKQLNQNEEGYDFYQTDTQLCIRNPYLKSPERIKDSCLSF